MTSKKNVTFQPKKGNIMRFTREIKSQNEFFFQMSKNYLKISWFMSCAFSNGPFGRYMAELCVMRGTRMPLVPRLI